MNITSVILFQGSDVFSYDKIDRFLNQMQNDWHDVQSDNAKYY